VKTENPSARLMANCKLCTSAISLYYLLSANYQSETRLESLIHVTIYTVHNTGKMRPEFRPRCRGTRNQCKFIGKVFLVLK
jgi:hypothetical protein